MNKKRSRNIKMFVIALIILITLVLVIFFLKKNLKPETLNLPERENATQDSMELTEEERKRFEKFKEGYFGALHGKVIEINQEEGRLKFETYQLEEPVIMEVSFDSKVEVNRMSLRVEYAEENRSRDDTPSIYEETVEKVDVSELKEGDSLQINSEELFKINSGEKVLASKIYLIN